MQHKHKKPKKSAFVSTINTVLTKEENEYCEKLKKALQNDSFLEDIGIISAIISKDGNERPLSVSREIVDKIEFDHGSIIPENMIINIHRWDYITTDVLGNQDKINLIKKIPDSDNYLLVAAIRINGFYTLTHFETKTSGDVNLKRLLGRGNVVERGHSIGLSTTNQGDEPTRECV